MDIYYYDISMLCGTEQEQEAAERLQRAGWEERLRAASRFRMEADRKRCLCAGLALLDALEEGNILPSAIKKTAEGKPFLEKNPEFHFNLSHSGNFAVCAVSGREVGIDIQEIQNPQEALLKRCCTEQERKRIRESSFPPAAFTVIWAWKEAFMKMTGQGLSIPPEKIEVFLPPEAESGISGGSAGSGNLFGKLSLRKSSVELRFGPMLLYEGGLGGMPVCVCQSLEDVSHFCYTC
ncbi:MAG: 4'-phosphopantetheinyl transferase superfamily protein [Stomatobaculum sp.]|nr:4'-phosphopantetheinyl transferase superfamily protein [Stomatobaculum sp.]